MSFSLPFGFYNSRLFQDSEKPILTKCTLHFLLLNYTHLLAAASHTMWCHDERNYSPRQNSQGHSYYPDL